MWSGLLFPWLLPLVRKLYIDHSCFSRLQFENKRGYCSCGFIALCYMTSIVRESNFCFLLEEGTIDFSY